MSSTTIEGKALSVEGDSCSDGSAVYAYVKEFDETEKAMLVTEIAATPANISLKLADENNKTSTISVIGLKGALYSPIQLENTDCEFVVDSPEKATVNAQGVVTAVAAGSAKVTVTYGGVSDEIDVVIE